MLQLLKKQLWYSALKSKRSKSTARSYQDDRLHEQRGTQRQSVWVSGCRAKKRLQVTYVTMVPWGNETLRHHALGTPCAWPALNLLCNLTNGRARRHRWVTSETRKHKSTCGKAGDSLKSWRTALARMPEVWQRDAASRSLKEPWLHT